MRKTTKQRDDTDQQICEIQQRKEEKQMTTFNYDTHTFDMRKQEWCDR